MLLRMVFPVAYLLQQEHKSLYERAKKDALLARPGEVTAAELYKLGPYIGRRYQITFEKAGRQKDLRMVFVGSTLYAISYERPGKEAMSAAGAAFLQRIALQPGYEDMPMIEERDRWRELGQPPFVLRYDASRWYRDPEDKEPGIFNLFHISKKAEVQLITEREPIAGDSLETAVLATARESAESVNVKKRGTRLLNGVEFLALEFEARVDGVNFINHGRFYSGPAGSVQLRGWTIQANLSDLQNDIDELLDGLTMTDSPKH